MSQKTRRALFRRVTVAAWGMVTVILVFVIILLCVELAKRTRPATVPQQAAAPAIPAPTIESPGVVPTVNVPLLFMDGSGAGLVAEMAPVEHTDSTVENCRNALQALIKGPQDKSLSPILPTNSKLRGVYLIEDGHLVVDFAIEMEIELRRFRSAAFEACMTYGIVNTLCAPELQTEKEGPVKMVTFLIEGMPPRESFPAHMDLSKPILPDQSWVVAAREQ